MSGACRRWTLLVVACMHGEAATSAEVVVSEGSADSCKSGERTTCTSALIQRHASVVNAGLMSAEQTDCYGEFQNVVVEEGQTVGQVMSTSSADDCKASCNRDAQCKSFTRCPQWNGCWMKDIVLDGGEATTINGACQTFFKRPCGGSGCYGEFTNMAMEEGNGVGQPLSTSSADECKARCNEDAQCKSFSLCPEWNGCWMKDQALVGDEATKTLGTCQTYYKKSCGDGAAPIPTPAPTFPVVVGQKIKVVSYNLYWWNAFGQNPWKGKHVTDNIKNNLRPDVLGLQECDDPNLIQSRTGYIPGSEFAGAQGVVVKPGSFAIGEKGHRDIGATGKWGPRYVTWVQLTHPSGRTFWHFNTHWCVHSGNGRTCSANKRYVGAQNMLQVIREKAGNAPTIITGDFNAGMGELGPQHFLANGFTMAVNNWVDAIFFSTGHWQKGLTDKGDPAHSDHPPVIAELEF